MEMAGRAFSEQQSRIGTRRHRDSVADSAGRDAGAPVRGLPWIGPLLLLAVVCVVRTHKLMAAW